MRTSIVLGLLVLLSNCTSFRKSPEPVKTQTPRPAPEKKVKRVTTPVKRPEKKQDKQEKQKKRSRAVWHLIYPADVEFVLTNRETNKKEFIRVETTLSDIELPAGHYNVDAVIVGDEKFDSLDGEEVFQFEIKKKAPTYIGSYVVECPKIGTLHFAELRKMKFFNRFNFTGNSGACEMIVGNDHENVRRAWSKLENKPGSKLLLGF
jgi:hypothetical protein